MGDWTETSLDHVVSLKRGFDLPTPNRRPGPYPVLGSSGISGWHDEGPVGGPGVTIGRSGASIGVATYFEGPYWPLNTTLFVEDFQGNDPRFIYYLLHGIDFQGFNSGSAQPSLNRNYIAGICITLPSRSEQQAISVVLGALDDKIAVNERIGLASLSLVDAYFQSVVQGIEAGPETFGSAASVYGGGTPRTSESAYWDGDIPWATPSDVTALSSPYLYKTGRTITESGLASCASRLYPAGSIFMTSRATIGSFAAAQVPAAVNQGFIVVVPPRSEMRWWFFHEMKSRVSEMLSLANGSTFLELSRTNFKAMQVRLADLNTIDRFDARVNPLHERAAKCAEESATLEQLRNTLLPKLMSGELRVRDAEKIVEDAA